MSIRKIGILCGYKFPEGMAPTTRIIAYGKGLVELGVHCEVVIFWPYLTGTPTPRQGEVSGVEYVYVHERPADRNVFRKVLMDRPQALLKAVREIARSNRREKFDYVLLSTDGILLMAFYITALKFLGIKVMFIGDEYPYPIRIQLRSGLSPFRSWVYHQISRGLSGRILMTKALKDFYDKTILPRPSHVLPMIVDCDRFSGDSSPPEDRYLCYMGNLELQKDNVDNIVRAFSLISKSYPDLRLRLYGTPNPQDLQVMKELIRELHLQDRVLLCGRASYGEVPEILKQAEILVSSQPRTKRAEGGFPTKLGEYLMSNRPVLLTDVGEISQYITDGKNAYIAPPEDTEAYARKLREILDHPGKADEVAACGKKFVEENFSGRVLCRKLIEFLDREKERAP